MLPFWRCVYLHLPTFTSKLIRLRTSFHDVEGGRNSVKSVWLPSVESGNPFSLRTEGYLFIQHPHIKY